jgi:type IV pilus assembly protein PilN
MIRINLLPVRQNQKRQTVQQQLVIGGMLLLATVVACVIWSAAISSQVDERNQQIAQKRNELKQLDKIIGEVNEFTTKKQELEDKLKIIDQLRKGKTGPVKALDDLATEIPNRVWLTNINESAGSVSIEGLAIEHEDVSAFMKSLQKSKYFGAINLKSSNEAKDPSSGVTLYQFKITCTVNYSA